MSDEPPKLPPEHAQLEYWHSTEQPLLHPVLLALCTFGGAAVGCVGTTLISSLSAAVLSQGPQPARATLWLACLIPIALAIGAGVMLERKLRSDRILSIQKRRRGGRFFVIGLLLGCGLTFLLEGICFTAVAANS